MVVTSMELAVSIQTTPQRLMQSLKDIKIENISNEESPLTAGEESSLTNSVQNNTIQTGLYIKIVNLFNFFVNNIILIHLLIFRHWNSQKIHNSEEYFRITHVWSWGPIYLKTSRARTKPSYHIGKIFINVQNFWFPKSFVLKLLFSIRIWFWRWPRLFPKNLSFPLQNRLTMRTNLPKLLDLQIFCIYSLNFSLVHHGFFLTNQLNIKKFLPLQRHKTLITPI